MGLMVLSASSFAQTCPTGSTLSGAACVANAGYYGSGQTFTACPAGKYNPNTGATSVTACTNVLRGYYSLAGATSATACPAGTWQRNGGQDKCGLPGAGYYAASVATIEQTLCPKDTFSGAPVTNWYPNTANAVGATSCSTCPANSTTASTGSTSSDGCLAVAGYYKAAGATTATA
jgi:hypothetical protein